jgi:hypothetical protein
MAAGLERYSQGVCVMRLRLSDAASFAFLAEQYRTHAVMCRQMASMTVGPIKEGWLEFADEWTKLAQETEVKAALEHE